MSRKVLIVEQSDAVRSVAETVLRQNGYDVIAVTAAEKAREVLQFTSPNLIIVGADLMAPDGNPYYERLQQDPKTGHIPMLLFEPSDQSDLGLPDEAVIPRPFDPKDLLNRVSIFMGAKEAATPAAQSPAAANGGDDEFLDAALGLDNINVTESEVMDKTTRIRRARSDGHSEKMIGLEPNSDMNSSSSRVPVVESLVLDEASGKAVRQAPGRKQVASEGSGKLEILPDQYGLTRPQSSARDEHADHDYNWFINAVRQDNDPVAVPPHGPTDKGGFEITEKSASVDPHTPGPRQDSSTSGGPSGEVEKFLNEFKKEMQLIRDTDSEQMIPDVKNLRPDDSGEKLDWDEKLEKVGLTEMEFFTREFARELGRKVADIIAAKIDSEKLLRLVKAEIVERYQKGK
jgi:DNA-binding response OmpR family regulator